MPKEAKQKIKLLYLLEVLLKNTDENRCMSSQDLIDYLAEKEIFVERKTIFSDIETLKQYGIDIGLSKSKNNKGYYIISRDFELAELKIIIEAILSSRYISIKKSKELITKLSDLVGPSERASLKREVFVQGRVKTENESIYYNVDILHNAMLDNKQISFLYLDWTVDKQLVPRKNGKLYKVSPWALTVKDENYYMVAYDEDGHMIKHYRVDKMKDITPVAKSQRIGKDQFDAFDLGQYTNRNFGMFSGEEEIITLHLPINKIGIIYDRFGKDIDVRKINEETVSCRVKVLVSQQFYGWLVGIGKDVIIDKPSTVAEDFSQYLNDILGLYTSKI